ncbi:helix-turn-helix transcriptional regulator [Pseudomonas sp. W2Oct36]|jgi:DNA-binding XRE family transcriptional regulator|uniref:helix-turn-helix domain-containing protein n=1 Tax=unclassified Pseudomonas TaxID=196821 RepID=UPI0011FA9E51|nr:helix-turn-helix transcriptional regulator [Pseudomonas sp.]RZI68909.1 MAG: XRE family transcriptional regulator [Pseudomonas sp.]
MDLQIISRDGEPEYAVLPWAQYQALLRAAGVAPGPEPEAATHIQAESEQSSSAADLPSLSQLGALREAKGLAVAQLARTVGISPSYLDLIESGAREPDAAIRRSLAWELGVAGWRGEA